MTICSIPMQPVMSFSNDKHKKFCRCHKCRRETKHRILKDDEVNFGEVLYRELHKNNT